MDNKSAETVPKKPFKAAMLSLLMGAGAGQIFNGQLFKGMVMIVLFIVPVILVANEIMNIYMRFLTRIMSGDLSVIPVIIEKITNSGVISSYSQFALVLWGISIVDAFYYAFLFNKKMAHELKSNENNVLVDSNEIKN